MIEFAMLNDKTAERLADFYYKPKTNADRIRGMSDEELANFLAFVLQDGYCFGAGIRDELKIIPVSDHNDMREWLKKEVEDES